MSSITSDERKKLKKEDFALPEKAPKSGSYPVDTKGRGIAALSYSKRYASPEEQKRIRAKVCSKYDLPSCKSPYEDPLS